jgi:butyrate kinase
VFNGKDEVFKENIKHSSEELKEFKSVSEQFPFRRDIVIKKLNDS